MHEPARGTADPRDERPRVLHLVKWLPRGGIETWLTHVFDNAADARVRHEVLVMQDDIGPYEAKVRRAGVAIHVLPKRGGWIGWFAALRKFLRQQGPFAALHAHVDTIVAGPALAVAAAAGVPVRIIHNHSARNQRVDYNPRRALRDRIGNLVTGRSATRLVAISYLAMEDLAGPRWRTRDDATILLYGFDYSGFRGAASRAEDLRRAHDIAETDRVVGHVGRFDGVKNHSFLIDAFALLAARDPAVKLVLVGRGPLVEQCQQQVERLGLKGRVVFAGATDDIPAFMALFDLFVLTSFSEGLGIVVLEAQAGGARVLMPDNLPPEVVVVEDAVDRLPLSAGEDAWAKRMADILARPPADSDAWLHAVEASSFGIARCVADLDAIYAEEMASHT